MRVDLPNALTLSRIGVIPFIVGLLFWASPKAYFIAAILFILACITDYFDGYFARTYQKVSPFGKFLDPLADKLLIAAILLMLTGNGQIAGASLIPAVIILLREILVSGLREFLAEIQISLPVSHVAKWKTGIQMTALSVLLLSGSLPCLKFLKIYGVIGLWSAALLTLMTGYDYFKATQRYLEQQDKQRPLTP